MTAETIWLLAMGVALAALVLGVLGRKELRDVAERRSARRRALLDRALDEADGRLLDQALRGRRRAQEDAIAVLRERAEPPPLDAVSPAPPISQLRSHRVPRRGRAVVLLGEMRCPCFAPCCGPARTRSGSAPRGR